MPGPNETPSTLRRGRRRPEDRSREAMFGELITELEQLRAEMLRSESAGLGQTQSIHPSYEASARNLLHYLALRSRDLRPLQEQLTALGLSSLGRAEAHVLATLDAVLRVLRRLAGRPELQLPIAGPRPDFRDGERLLERHAEALLGPPQQQRRVRILVTLPSEAAGDYTLVRRLLERGMDCARINCAHDDAASWARMIENLRRAEKATGKHCRVLMDLAGPKLRTGPIEPGPPVLKIRPTRDALGRVVRPAQVWLTAAATPAPAPAACEAVLPLHAAWLTTLARGDRIGFTDARGARRRLRVVRRLAGGAWAEISSTCYVPSGARVALARARPRGRTRPAGRIGELPRPRGEIVLAPGDELVLTRALDPGCGADRDERGRLLAPARVGCTLPEVFANVRVGEKIWLDDGRIGGIVRSVEQEALHLEVTVARPQGEKLRADKGINLPDTDLRLPALTPKDIVDLAFVAAHANIVALSFVHDPADVLELEKRLRELNRPELGIVLKIETKRAFERLPDLLLASMQSPCDGVMIARGDLAVECGFERLAEVQEEILWICEAAHIPVVWATQVLESLAKDGRPSRAEITDAAMGERAECVMLNKGPHIESAVGLLDDILRRMEGHQRKKSSMLRQLKLASGPRA